MTIRDLHADHASLLDSFGTQMVLDRFAVFTDFNKAENAYVHHTAVPVALTTFATISPAFARGRFPDFTMADLVLKRPHMDHREASALAAVCGERIPLDLAFDGRAFEAHLLDVIDRHGFKGFYGRYPDQPACFGIDVRPHGIDWQSHEANEAGLRAWREAYGALEPSGQIIVATIMWLYMARKDCPWLKRLPHRWHAADAVSLLKTAGSLGDWAKLVALYRGW